MNELTKKDKRILGNLFEMVGYCETTLNMLFPHPNKIPDHKYLGRMMDDFKHQVQQIEKQLNEFTKEWNSDAPAR